MRKDGTLGVQAAYARARIAALVVDACPIAGALIVGHAFGSAAAVRIAEIIGDARARAGAVLLFADGVGSARRR